MTEDDPNEVLRLVGYFNLKMSMLDMFLPLILSKICNISGRVAVKIYMSQENVSARRAILDAAANSILTGDLLKRYNALSATHADLFARRNRIMHDVWVIDDKENIFRRFSFARLKKSAPLDQQIPPIRVSELQQYCERAEQLIIDLAKLWEALPEITCAEKPGK